jgi:hypothetical protein
VDAIDQWGDRQRDIVRRERRAGILTEATRLIRSSDFPVPILDRRYVVAASLLHWLGRGDYSYVMDYASSFSQFWRVAEGRWRLAMPTRDGNGGGAVAQDMRNSVRG